MSEKEVLEKARALLSRGKLSKAELRALEALGYELKSLKGGKGMKRKHIGEASKKTSKVKRGRGGFGSGVSNFEAYGTVLKPTMTLREVIKKFPKGIFMSGHEEFRKMAETNGTGTACVVYRVAANK